MGLLDRIRTPAAPILLAAAAAVWNVRDLSRHWADGLADPSPGAELAIGIRIAAMLLQLTLLAYALVKRRSERTSARRVRAMALYVPAAALLSTSLARAAITADAEALLPRTIFFTVLLLGSGLLVSLPGPRPVGDAKSRSDPLARVDLVASNVVAAVVVLELALASWARIAPSPLLFAETVEARVEAARPAPHSSWLGGSLNEGGYLDEPFFAAGDGDLVVAVLADSFGIGVVPYAENYVTIAEERLREVLGSRYQRVALHNFGVPAVGLEEYAYLLETEALRTGPTLVVLCIFVGNDITGDRPFGAPPRGRFSLQSWYVVQLPVRLLARARAPEYVEGLAAGADAKPGRGPSREPPRFSPEDYLDLESRRLDVTNTADRRVEKRYARFFSGLDYFSDRLDGRLVVLVFPDEFQVEDDLWRRALELQRSPEDHDRDLPQRRIATWASANEVALVDTTDALRRAQREAPVYAPRNTHLNTRGNRVAGELLAEQLTRSLTGAEGR